MKLNKLSLVAALFITSFFAACTGEVEPKPENQITSDSGLKVILEWQVEGKTISESMEAVDISLELYKNEEKLDYGYGIYSFPSVEVADHYADGTYDISLDYWYGEERVDYTVYVKGNSEGSSEPMEFTSYFLAEDANAVVDFLEIVKQGNTYTINKK